MKAQPILAAFVIVVALAILYVADWKRKSTELEQSTLAREIESAYERGKAAGIAEGRKAGFANGEEAGKADGFVNFMEMLESTHGAGKSANWERLKSQYRRVAEAARERQQRGE